MIKVNKVIKDKKTKNSVEKSGNQKIDKDLLDQLTVLEKKPRDRNLRVIKTARGIESINNAVEEGFTPLIKEVKQNERIYVKDVLIRDKITGKFETMVYNFYAVAYGTSEDKEIVMKTKKYYPYQFPLPFAAYLIPKDLKAGEKVFIEDIIEDIIEGIHSYGTYRLDRAEAIWNGEDFEIDEGDIFANITMG